MKNNYKKKLTFMLCICIMGSMLLEPITINANTNSKPLINYFSNKELNYINFETPTVPEPATPAPTIIPTPAVTIQSTSQPLQDREMSNSAVVIDRLYYYFKNAKPMIKDNQVLIPIEEFATMLDYTVSWNQGKTTLTMMAKDEGKFVFTKNSNTYLYNNQTYTLATNCIMQSFGTNESMMVDIGVLSGFGVTYALYGKEEVQAVNDTFEDLFVLTTDQQEPILRPDFNYPRKEVSVDCFALSLSPYSTKALSLKQINKKLKKYGKVINEGLSLQLYKDTMSKEWRDVTQYNIPSSKVTVDLSKKMDYDAYEKLLLQLSRYEGVYVYVIGKSTEGRNIYSITIDMGDNPNKNVFMFTGQTHAREFAGGSFILKQFSDLIQKAQTDPQTLERLQNTKYVAVPIINVDAREAIINKSSKYINSSIGLWKAYINGTDGNRNYPGISANQLAKGIRKNSKIKARPSAGCYNGSYSGSNKETQAMMKWIYYYVVQEKASYLGDYHMQGRLMYGGKTWDLSKNYDRNKKKAYLLMSFLNKGNRSKYSYMKEKWNYGIDGDGSTLTDFAVACAIGAKYSTAYGTFVMIDSKTKKEYTLIQYKKLDKFKGVYRQANSKFVTTTFEIGYGANTLGYTAYTRNKMAQEYKNYHYGKLLEKLPELILK